MSDILMNAPSEPGCGCSAGMPARRRFLRTLVVTAASLVVLPAALAAADTVPVTWVDLGSQPEPSTTWTQIVLPAAFNSEVVFIRKVIPEGGAPIYQAVSARCSHHHCVVAYDSADVTFVCPCHGGTFDSNAYPISGPPKNALPPLLAQWTPEGHKSKLGRLLIEAPNPKSTTQED